MKDGLVLTFDIGTQSMRGMLVNKNGKIEVLEQIVYEKPYYSKCKDWAENDPDFYYETLCNIAKIIKRKHILKFKKIIGVTTTVFRDSTICLDENNKPLRDMILWLDKREIDNDEVTIPLYKKLLFKIVGAGDIADMQHKQSVCNYIMTREPEIWAKTKKYVVLSTYINFKLTGILIDSSANQIGHLPFNYKKGTWLSNNALTRCIYDVPSDKLCDLCKPGEIIGKISKRCSKESGLPEVDYVVTGSDKGCETIGLSVTGENKAAVSLGTSATIQLSSSKYFEPQRFCPSYASVLKSIYNPEYQVYRGFWMLSWFKKNFVTENDIRNAKRKKLSIEDYFNSYLNDVAVGCDGLILQPHFSPGVANPNAKGSIIGFSDVHNKYHVYRAIIEGINYELIYGLETMSKRGHKQIKEIYVSGGASKSSQICQICADMFGLPVKRIQTHEACGLGASIIAFLSLGIYPDINEAINHMVFVKEIYEPNMNKHKFYYDTYKNVYKKITNRLVPLFVINKNISINK